VVNILSIEVELFTIRCGINQAVNIPDINYIIIITNAIYATEKILDSFCHPYQLHTITISHKLKTFFQANPINSMAFWNCPSSDKWYKNLNYSTLELLLVQVDKENSIEFPFNCYILLIHILYLLLFIKSYTSLLSHSLSYTCWFPN